MEGGIQRRNDFREWRVLLIFEESVRDVRGRGFIGGLGVLMVVEMEDRSRGGFDGGEVK